MPDDTCDGVNAVIADLAAFLGISSDAVRARMRGGIGATAQAYCAEGDDARFYAETDAYLFELAAYADDPLRSGLARLLAENMPGARILEYGCGIGTQAIRFAEAGFAVVASDANLRQREFLAYRCARHAWGARVRVLPPDESLAEEYDVISCQHVLEHVDDPRALLGQFHAALMPGGLFAGIAPFGLVGPEFPEHRLAHAHLRLETLCAECGFRVVEVTPFGAYDHFPFELVLAIRP